MLQSCSRNTRPAHQSTSPLNWVMTGRSHLPVGIVLLLLSSLLLYPEDHNSETGSSAMQTIFLGLEGVSRQKMSYNFKITGKFLRWHVGWEVGIPSKVVGPFPQLGCSWTDIPMEDTELCWSSHTYLLFFKRKLRHSIAISCLGCLFFYLLDSCRGFFKDQRNSLFLKSCTDAQSSEIAVFLVSTHNGLKKIIRCKVPYYRVRAGHLISE